MSRYVTVFVVVAVAILSLVGYAFGLDTYAAVILALIVGLGWLAVAVSRKGDAGLARPATCSECGGLVSPNAPYCKHCGALLAGKG